MGFFIRIRDFCYYNRKIIACLLFLAFLVIFFYLEYSFSKDKSIDSENEIVEVLVEEVEDNKKIVDEEFYVVDIKGAILSPGTYTVASDARVIDVIDMAGGILEDSDTTSVNLSKRVSDEMMIIIPYKGEEIKSNGILNNDIVNSNDLYSDGKVSINSANLSELMTISGIGEVKAKAIIEYRETNGAFSSIDDIKKVSGIGNSTFEKIKDYIKL